MAGVIGEVRAAAELTLRVRVDVHGQQLRRTVLYRARADLFLTEGVSTGGLHAFSFRGLHAQAAWLASAVAPDLRGGRTEPARICAAPEDLEVSSEELAAASHVAALVFAPCAGDAPTRSFHAYADAAGVQVLHRRPETGTLTLQRLSVQDLVAFCAGFLSHTKA